MNTVALADVSELIDYGVTASARPEPVGPKFLRITDIQDGAVDWETVPFCEGDERKLRSSRLRPGDIVFARTGATTGKSFLIRHCPDQAVFASYLIRVRPSHRIDAGFLAHFFNSPEYWQQISLKAAGAAQPGVNASKLEELLVPLPALEEQRRIAAILDQADAVRAKRRAALAQLDEMARAIFVEMFGDPGDGSARWPLVPLGEIARIVRGASPRPKGDPRYFGGSIPWLMISDVTRQPGRVLTVVRETVTEAGRDKSVHLSAGTLILTNSATVGVPKVLGLDACVHDGFLAFLDLRRDVRRDFLYFALSLLRDELVSLAPEGTQKNLNTPIVKGFRIPLPPLDQQDLFLRRVEATEQIGVSQRQAAEELDGLFTSLQHRAFQGEL